MRLHRPELRKALQGRRLVAARLPAGTAAIALSSTARRGHAGQRSRLAAPDLRFGHAGLGAGGGRPLAAAGRILVTAVGRSHNSDMLWDPENSHRLLDEGRGPVLFEPLAGWLELPPGRRVAGAWALDVRGGRTAAALIEESAGRLGSGAPSLHYEVELA